MRAPHEEVKYFSPIFRLLRFGLGIIPQKETRDGPSEGLHWTQAC
jgi:hypothetical protein